MTQIWINDSLVDMFEDTFIPINVQKINIADLKTRSVNFAANVSLPWTKQNALIFGFAYDLNSVTSAPYTKLATKVVQNGVEMFVDGVAIIMMAEKRKLSISIFENIYDYFLIVNTLQVKDLNLITNSAWNAAAIDAARTNTSGIISAILSWGRAGAIYQFNFFLPCFFYHTIINGILAYTGLTASGAILTDTDYLDLVIPFPGDKFVYPRSYVDSSAAKVSRTTDLVIGQVLTGVRLIFFENIDYGANITTTEYTFTDVINCTVTAVLRVNGIVWNLATTLRIQILKNGVEIAFYQTASPTTDTGVQTLTVTDNFIAGDIVKLNIQSNFGSVPDGVDCTVLSTATLTISPTTDVNRALVAWNVLLPEISCQQVLSDFFNRFGIIPKQEGTNLILKTIKEIIDDRGNAVDWSDKEVGDDFSIKFDSEYAQANRFLYAKIDLVGDALLGSGSIDISNNRLPPQRDILSSVFGNALTEDNGGYLVATVPVYGAASVAIKDFITSPELRLLTLKSRTTEASVIFDSTPRTDYKMAYFTDVTLLKDTGFKYFVNKYYDGLEQALQNNKIVDKQFLLTDSDIAQFDPHKLIWDGKSYFIVNKISNFISGRVTKVELFKV